MTVCKCSCIVLSVRREHPKKGQNHEGHHQRLLWRLQHQEGHCPRARVWQVWHLQRQASHWRASHLHARKRRERRRGLFQPHRCHHSRRCYWLVDWWVWRPWIPLLHHRRAPWRVVSRWGGRWGGRWGVDHTHTTGGQSAAFFF